MTPRSPSSTRRSSASETATTGSSPTDTRRSVLGGSAAASALTAGCTGNRFYDHLAVDVTSPQDGWVAAQGAC